VITACNLASCMSSACLVRILQDFVFIRMGHYAYSEKLYQKPVENNVFPLPFLAPKFSSIKHFSDWLLVEYRPEFIRWIDVSKRCHVVEIILYLTSYTELYNSYTQYLFFG
jgi:hypothetical protein